MADITFKGQDFYGVPAVNMQKQGGGLAPFYEYSFIGKIPETIGNIYDSGEVALKDTDYNTWTPSTTAAVIVASQDITYAADLANYEYMVKWAFEFKPVLLSGAITKAQVILEAADLYQSIFKRPANIQSMQVCDFNGNASATFFTIPFLRYWNTSGNDAYTYSMAYGIFPTLVNPAFDNATSDTPVITFKVPTVSARCNNSYFAAARAPELDKNASKYRLVGTLYRTLKGAPSRAMYDDFFTRISPDM